MKRLRFYLGLAIMNAFQAMSCGSGGSSNSSTESGNGGWFGTDTGRLDLIFSLTFDETSKDSNSHSFEITIIDGKLVYKQTYSGFIEQPEEVHTKKIDAKTENEIRDYLEKTKLTGSLTEKKNTRGIGVATYMTLEIRQPEASMIHIEGKKTIWEMDNQLTGDDAKTDTLSLSKEALEILDSGQGFVGFIENLIK
jgi:hypothetical protein